MATDPNAKKFEKFLEEYGKNVTYGDFRKSLEDTYYAEYIHLYKFLSYNDYKEIEPAWINFRDQQLDLYDRIAERKKKKAEDARVRKRDPDYQSKFHTRDQLDRDSHADADYEEDDLRDYKFPYVHDLEIHNKKRLAAGQSLITPDDYIVISRNHGTPEAEMVNIIAQMNEYKDYLRNQEIANKTRNDTSATATATPAPGPKQTGKGTVTNSYGKVIINF